MGQLSLLAYLGLTTSHHDGIDSETAIAELWPTHHSDGTLRQIRPAALKKRMWELRRALTGLIASGNPKDAIPDAVNQRYRLTGVTCDWTELTTAIRHAEATRTGTQQWDTAITTILALIKPPGLLTAPQRRRFTWTDHYEPLIHDTTRRLQAICATHANHLTHNQHPRTALDILATVRGISPDYAQPVATATVTALLTAGDPTAAEAEVATYERQLDPTLATRERTDPTPRGPRAILNHHRQRPPS
jgi:hypothetical protein